MQINIKPVTIFTANLGSGKTEISINFAGMLQMRGAKVSLVDLDIINPYFRTRLAKDNLAARGLRVICPPGHLVNADVPALTPAIRGALQAPEGYCVCDVGGDDVGAIALGAYRPFLPEGRFDLYFVVNTCRPFTRDFDGVVKIMRSIETNSRLRVTGLVSNTNLGRQTDVEVMVDGYGKVSRMAEKLGLPVAFLAAPAPLAAETAARLPGVAVLPLEFHMKTPWEEVCGEW
ncbi:hypothetical protein [Desulforamulus hydrothermalis]|uniref:CobQ/CobB/MinD/ParA nucleotide binding domain-containing protein n=1 Tax=Desulforamulus hydrothermalis Lam5 = DSM 18033 TaxID=1121428 RepID=K8E0B0_9FIRM|nr:hypothetical protein [Desulforamulus hydrothermalis]CCO08942.1 conserved hypothetical protein [Desulforamulus hydrothermalis Lam5 = DSM 18033]SHG75307.1 hypothetical protein SAMN02745177_00259 [Desulforamulus hydrothermalis Lam5 = DSM 18033]